MKTPDLSGRICLITGATSGIGQATAEEMAKTGVTLVVHGRDPEKAEPLCERLRSDSGNQDVHFLTADFAALDEVAAMAAEFRDRFGALHLLFNNAGVLTDHRQVSRDGFELTFGVNHLAPFLLTNLLQDLLIQNAPARIAINSSSALGGGQLNFSDLQLEKAFEGWSAYANTKLANMLMSMLLAERLADKQVAVNSFCPGLIDTNLLTGNREFGEARVERMRAGMRPPLQGAATPLFLLTDPEAAAISGAFFLRNQGEGRQPLEIGWDRDVAERLWDVSAELVSPWLK